MHPERQRSATWEDLKQFAWGLLSVLPFGIVAAWGARVLVGGWSAFWLCIGVLAFVYAAYGSVLAACLLVSYAIDAMRPVLRYLHAHQHRTSHDC